jgi:hypothetical protein
MAECHRDVKFTQHTQQSILKCRDSSQMNIIELNIEHIMIMHFH